MTMGGIYNCPELLERLAIEEKIEGGSLPPATKLNLDSTITVNAKRDYLVQSNVNA